MEWRTFNPAATYLTMESQRTLTVVQLFHKKNYVRLGIVAPEIRRALRWHGVGAWHGMAT